MDEERKRLLTAGVCLGDITLAMAAIGEALPSYVAGLDVDQLLSGCSDVDAVRGEIERELAGAGDDGSLPPGLVRTTLDRAIGAGKFLSAIRCLEILGEKNAYVDRTLQDARKKTEGSMLPEAARALVIAANLDLPDGVPPFQYSGPDLHSTCTSEPENCITRLERENAVLKALKYLLPSEKVHQMISELAAEVREELLARVAMERDPEIGTFLGSLEQAHRDLVDAREHTLADLVATVEKVEKEVARFAGSLGKTTGANAEQKEALDRLRLTTAGLSKELVDLEALVRNRQFHRLTRRLEQLIESREQIEETATLGDLKKGPSGSAFDSILALIREMTEKNILEEVKTLEEQLLSVQVTMLGRSVHSHEHWQYLRELAFKYPASPLMCCVSRMNDRWMVVPAWESPVTEILKSRVGAAGAERG